MFHGTPLVVDDNHVAMFSCCFSVACISYRVGTLQHGVCCLFSSSDATCFNYLYCSIMFYVNYCCLLHRSIFLCYGVEESPLLSCIVHIA
jgi:hypothetical protein